MSKLKLIVGVLCLLAVMGLGWWISYENSQRVAPIVLGFVLPNWTLGVWLFATLIVGGLLGYLISLVTYLKYRGRVLQLQHKLKKCEQDNAKIRESTLRD